MWPVDEEGWSGGRGETEIAEVAGTAGIAEISGISEGVAVLSADIGGPQKMQCTDEPRRWQAGRGHGYCTFWRGLLQAGEERSP